MDYKIDIKDMSTKIEKFKQMAEEINKAADNFPAVRQNMKRIFSSIKMLEMNVTDLKDSSPV